MNFDWYDILGTIGDVMGIVDIRSLYAS